MIRNPLPKTTLSDGVHVRPIAAICLLCAVTDQVTDSSGPGNQGLDQILVKIALGGQPVDGHVFQQLVAHSPDAVDFSICNDINQSWTNSPAVMDYAKCSGSNKVYLDALWKVEEAKAHARAVDFMGNQVGAIKRKFLQVVQICQERNSNNHRAVDVQNRKISKLNAEAVKEEIMGKIEQLESEAREVRPSWFA